MNPARIITGENASEYSGRLVRVLDRQGNCDRTPYQIKELTNRVWIQDFDFGDDGFKFGILLPPYDPLLSDERYNDYIKNDILPQLEHYETFVRVKYKNGQTYIFAVPRSFDTLRFSREGTSLMPYYLEVARVGKPKFDFMDGKSSGLLPDHYELFSAYKIRKNLTRRKNLKKAKHKLAIAKTLHSRLGDDANLNPDIMQNVIDHLSTMEINPDVYKRMTKERSPTNNNWHDLSIFYSLY